MTPAKTLLLVPLLVCSVAAVTMECSGSTSSNCRGKQCTVICSDGNKVDLFCEEGGVSISSTNDFSGGKSTVDAQCGKKIKFKACFPFCGSETPFSSETQSSTKSKPQSPSRTPSSTISKPASPSKTASLKKSNPKPSPIVTPSRKTNSRPQIPSRTPSSTKPRPVSSQPSVPNRGGSFFQPFYVPVPSRNGLFFQPFFIPASSFQTFSRPSFVNPFAGGVPNCFPFCK